MSNKLLIINDRLDNLDNPPRRGLSSREGAPAVGLDNLDNLDVLRCARTIAGARARAHRCHGRLGCLNVEGIRVSG